MAWGASSAQDIAIAMAVRLTGEENLKRLSGGLSQIDKAARSAAASSAVGVSAATKSLALAERTLQQGLAETQRGEDLLTAIASKSARTRSTIRYQEMTASANAIKANGQATTAYAQKMIDLHRQELAAAQAAEQASNQGTSSLLGNLSKVVAAVALAVAAFKAFEKVVSELWSLAEDAAPLETIRLSFEHLTEGQGDMLAAMEAATLGTASQMDLMVKYNMASQLMEDSVARRLPEAMQYLTKVGAATGISMEYMLNSLVTGIGRLSYRYLDNIGVVVKLEDATKRAAEAYGIEEDAVTQAQKQEALMAITIEQLAANTAHIPDFMGSATQVTQAYAAAKKNAANAIGEAFLPALKQILPPLTELVTQLAEFAIPAVSDFAQKIGQSGANVIKMISAITTLIERQRELNELKAAELSTKLPEGIDEDMAARLLMQRVYTEDNLAQALRNRTIAEASRIEAIRATRMETELLLATEQQMQTNTNGLAEMRKAQMAKMAEAAKMLDAEMQLLIATEQEFQTATHTTATRTLDEIRLAFTGVYDEVVNITQDGQGKLLEMQAKWAAQEKAEQQNLTVETITQAQDRALKMAEIEAKYRSEMAALQQEGDAEKIAKAQQSHQIELIELSNKFAQEDAISRRAMLIERYQQANARIAELNALRDANRAKIVEAIAQAGAEQGLTEAQINARLTALGLQLSAEQKIAVERALLNKAMLENDEASTKKYIALIEARILAAKYAQEKAADDALEAIRGIQLPALELPPMQFFGDIGGAGGGDAAKKTETAAESLEATIGRISTTISSAIAALREVADYESLELTAGMQALADNMEEAITILMHTAWKFGDAERDWRDIPKAAAEFAGWASTVLSAFGTAATTLTAVGEYKIKDINEQLDAIALGTEDIIIKTQQTLEWFKANNDDWRMVAEEISAFSQYAVLAVGWIGPAIDALTALDKYSELGYESIERTQKGIDYLYVNTKALLGMLQVIGPAWGRTAKEIKDLVGDIGDAVAPVQDMVDTLTAIAEYAETDPGNSVAKFEAGLAWIYVNTQKVMGMVQELVRIWGDTAKKIYEAAEAIGDAVAPVQDIADTLIAIAEYGDTKPGDNIAKFEEGLSWIYVNAQKAMGMLQELVRIWGGVATKIYEASDAIGKSIAPIKDMVDGLIAIAEYGDTKPGNAVRQFEEGLSWIYVNTQKAMGMLQELVRIWGDTATKIYEASEHIGKAIAPLKDMVEGLAAIAEYGGTKPGAYVQQFEAGLAWAYVNTQKAMGMLQELVRIWGSTATKIYEASEHIGKAVAPLKDMVETLAAIAEYGTTKPGAHIQQFEAGLAWAYVNTKQVMGMLQELTRIWGEVATSISAQSQAIGDTVSPVKDMVEALAAIAEYGGTKPGASTQEFTAGINWMYKNTNELLGMLVPLANKWKNDLTQEVQDAATAVKTVVEPVTELIDALAAIAEYKQAKDLEAKVDTFLADVDIVVTKLRDHYAKTQENILEANKQAAKAATSVSELLEPASTITEALTSISEYKATKNMDKKVERMISDARTIGRALIQWFQTWKSSTWENVDMGGAAMGKLKTMFEPIKTIVDSVTGIAEYQGASASKVTLFLDSAVTITGLIAEWVANRGPEFESQLDSFAEFTSPVLTKWAEALGPIGEILDMASGILDITKDKAYQIQFPITAALDALIAISEEVRLWVFNQGPGFKKRMVQLKKQTTGPLNAMIEALTPMQNLISMASDLASEEDWELAKTFQANIGPALNAIVKGINNALDVLNKSEVKESLYDTGFATGQDLGLGIIAGINSMILPVQAAVGTIYNAVKPPALGGPSQPPGIMPLGPVNTTPVVYQNHVNITGNTFVGSDNATVQLIASLVEARIMARVTRRTAGAATQ